MYLFIKLKVVIKAFNLVCTAKNSIQLVRSCNGHLGDSEPFLSSLVCGKQVVNVFQFLPNLFWNCIPGDSVFAYNTAISTLPFIWLMIFSSYQTIECFFTLLILLENGPFYDFKHDLVYEKRNRPRHNLFQQ